MARTARKRGLGSRPIRSKIQPLSYSYTYTQPEPYLGFCIVIVLHFKTFASTNSIIPQTRTLVFLPSDSFSFFSFFLENVKAQDMHSNINTEVRTHIHTYTYTHIYTYTCTLVATLSSSSISKLHKLSIPFCSSFFIFWIDFFRSMSSLKLIVSSPLSLRLLSSL